MSINPIQKKIRVERTFKKFAESIVGSKNFGWLSVLYLCLYFIASAWFAEGVAKYIDYLLNGCGSAVVNYKLLISIFIIFSFWLFIANIVQGDNDKIVVNNDQSLPVRRLVLFLSNFQKFAGNESSMSNSDGVTKESLEKALGDNSFHFNLLFNTSWEMPFRAIQHHISKLQYIVLVASSGGRRSSLESGLFIKLVHALYPNIRIEEQVVDFENLEQIFDLINHVYEKAQQEGLKDSDVLVDITGGQKTNSIAAAIATLAIGRQFEYITTGEKIVRSYDVGYFSRDTA
jgi:hypothetical protein